MLDKLLFSFSNSLAQGAAESLGAPAAGAASSSAAAPAASAARQDSPFWSIVPFIGIFAVFYFFVLRPQSKRTKTHQAFVDSLTTGTTVVTSSGLFGKIVGFEDNVAKLEIADRVIIRVLKSQIAGPAANAAQAVADANPKS